MVRTGLLIGLVGVVIHLSSSVVSPIVPFFVIGLLYFLMQIPGVPGPERTPPLFDEQTLAGGLGFGVAAVQGGRPYMEDMYQVVTFNGSNTSVGGGSNGAGLNNTTVASPAADKLGLINFFAVYDGHGGKLAAQYVHKHLVPRIVSALEQHTASAGGGASGGAEGEEGEEAILSRSLKDAFLQADDAFIRVRARPCPGSLRGAPAPACGSGSTAWRARALCRGARAQQRHRLPPAG